MTPESDASDPDPPGGPAERRSTPVVDDRLDALRRRLDDVSSLPVSERLAIFDEVNAALAAELARLDEL